MMQNKETELEETLLQLATVFRGRAATKYVFHQERFASLQEAACEAEKVYMEMNITEAQRAVIDLLLKRRLETSEYELTWMYMAGLIDGIKFLQDNEIIDIYTGC